MRIAIIGGTGNVGTSVIHALAADEHVEAIRALARRRPQKEFPKTEFAELDVVDGEIAPALQGCDAVIHLAWLIQPGRTESITRAVNVTGTERVLRAVAEARVPALVYASSVGAYSPGPKDRAVDESWPTEGIATSFYARHKAATERLLDRFEREHPEIRVARLRPGLIFKREAASEVRRLFAGPLLPGWLVRESLIPVVPDIPRLRFQAVHSLDVGEAYRLAAVNGEARGAFNVAAEPVLDPPTLAEILGARTIRMSAGVVRALAAATFMLHLQPTEPGWLDMALSVPIMDTTRARSELGWEPRHTAAEALRELLAGMREGAELATPPLARGTSGPARVRELLTGVGHRP
jgi:nucleoside-diphosphate-sugar epimerase